MTVPPGEERILVIKKLSPSCSYSIQRQYYFTQGQQNYLNMVKTHGTSVQIEYDCRPYDIFFYVMWGGYDFYLMMENNTADDVCMARFALTLTNMQDAEQPGVSEWEVKVAPGESVTRKLIPIDPNQQVDVQYNYSASVERMIGSGQEMISLIKSKGSCQYMTYNGATVDVRCYSAYLQKKFYFLFENNTSFVYDATYTFQMTNLCIERGDGTDSFRIRLRPGQTCLRSLAPIDPAAKSTISYNFTFTLEQ